MTIDTCGARPVGLNRLGMLLPHKVYKTLRFIGRTVAFWLFLGTLGSVFLAGVELVIAGFLQLFLKSIGLLPANLSTVPFLDNYTPPPWAISLLLIGIASVRILGQYLVLQSSITAQETIVARLRLVLLYQMLLHKKQQFFAASKSHYLLGGIFPATGSCILSFSQFFTTTIQSALLFSIMLVMAWKESLVGVVGFFFLGSAIHLITKKIRAKGTVIPEQTNKLIQGIERVARNWILIRVLRAQNTEHVQFVNNVNTVRRHAIQTGMLSSLAAAGTPFVGILLLIIIIFFSQNVFLTPGATLLSFLYLFVRFVQGLSVGVSGFGFANQHFPAFLEAAHFFFGFSREELDLALQPPSVLPKNVLSTGDPNSLDHVPGVVCENVTFSFGDKKIFENLNFHIPRGSQYGIVGPSGAGKSTLLAMILGLVEPVSGSLQVNGQNPGVFFGQANSCIGYVGCEPFLIAGSIRQNILYGHSHATDEEIWDALEWAKMAKVVRDLPGQLNYLIAENGEGLSAGQKQRLCLARAVLKSPTLLVLDEATANLDKETEKDIVENLKDFKHRATVLIVSHRSETLTYADHILDLR